MDILKLNDAKTIPDIIHPYPDSIKNNSIPLIIDNGSCYSRVGWATFKKPQLTFRNLIAKPRKERGKKDGEIQVGNDITNIEAVRFQLKTQFDRNIVTYFEAQEQIFDYMFTHLGIDTQGCVQHPIVLTEGFLNPNYCRNQMAELLFECYDVPSVAYGVDFLWSYQHNSCPPDGLIISMGYYTTHIIPILNGKAEVANSRRINVGGYHVTFYLHRLLQLKYPAHLNAITPCRAEELIHNHSKIALRYQEEISKWSDPEYYDLNVLKIQLPYVAPANPTITAEQQKERKRELAKRLMEINARKREERLAEDKEQLKELLAIRELLDDGDTKECEEALRSYSIANEAELMKAINSLQLKIDKNKQKILAAATSQEENIFNEDPKPKLKSSLQQPKDQPDLEEWINSVRKKRKEILEKRMARHQRRQDLAKRRTVAAQERMRLINQLARKDKKDDDFGTRDEDWEVYKVINKEGGDTDSEVEQEKLVEFEEILRHHDPEFENPSNIQLVPGEAHQLHVGTERLRATEILFQPFMIGLNEAGIAETIEFLLKKYSDQDQNRLTSNIFLTGGTSSIPGLINRLKREFREMRPFNSSFKINSARFPSLDAWLGARDFGLSNNLVDHLVTRMDYQEKGGEYLKEHDTSNIYTPSPDPLPTMQVPMLLEQSIVDDSMLDIEIE